MSDDRDFRRAFYQALGPSPQERSGGAGPDWMADLYPAEHDPLPKVVRALREAGPQSVQIVAGGKGTGRASGLRALVDLLRKDEAVVVSVDLHALLRPHAPLASIELRLALIGAIDEALGDGVLNGALPGPTTWERAAALLPQGVGRRMPMDPARVREALSGGLTGGIRLASGLAGMEDELRSNLLQRYDELLQATWGRRGPAVRLVVLVEGLDRLGPGGPVLAPGAVMQHMLAAGSVFALPETHLVLVAPAVSWWLRDELVMGMPGGRVHWWPAVPVVDDTGAIDPLRSDRLSELVQRRGDWRRVLPEPGLMTELIRMSGGHLRKLFDMVREVVLASGGSTRGAALVARALRTARAPLRTRLDAAHHAVLEEVATTHRLPLDDGLPTAATLDLIDQGLLLGYPSADGPEPRFRVAPVALSGGVGP